MHAKIAFLDTTVFLHYRSIEEIDWNRLLSARQVVLVITQTVIRQLNEIKDRPSKGKKLRARANLALMKFETLFGKERPIVLKDGIEIQFEETEPQVDFDKHQLSLRIADDGLLASIICYRDSSQSAGQSLCLITDDVGLRIKANARGITAMALPPEQRLPDELDETEKRVKQLERKLLEYEARVPNLSLDFGEGNSHLNVKLPRHSTQELERTIVERMEQIHSAHAYLPDVVHSKTISRGLLPVVAYPFRQNRDYNSSLRQFFAEYEAYLQERLSKEQTMVTLELVLRNSGTCPADNVDVFLDFPIHVFGGAELPFPQAPYPPRSPNDLSSFGDLIQPAFNRELPNVSSPSFERLKSNQKTTVHFRIRQAKHHLPLEMAPLHVLFVKVEEARSFSFSYSIIAANVSYPIKGNLHVSVHPVAK